ncbi:MAG: DUF3316 domain-containing protein [Muribaculaceae bacterium]|nr:DUF3316 domain-containing protein [Muribaculaceae bacterium]
MRLELKYIIVLVCIFSKLFTINASTIQGDDSIKIVRPVNSAYMLNIGSASILDTYLTPITYDGINLRLGYERMQAMKFAPTRWTMQMDFGIEYANVQNIVKNRTMHSLMCDFTWGMMHRWNINKKIIVYAGGSTSFNGGVIYNQYNSNNPVSAKIRWGVNITAMAIYNLKIWKLPVTLRYQPTIPVLGAFFSPDYGEAFYEIYVGNRDGLVHLGWWGNRFDMINLFTADLHFGNTSLRLGYRGTIESSWINNISTQIFTHNAIIGVSGEWINIRPTKKLDTKVKIISTIY